ncbi:MAG: ParB/RepB/Spo0J family partition protein [Rickettsiales bacterium]|nr:ParB/RepB/Spo0J family partition protein [Rickettsiales bacterium]
MANRRLGRGLSELLGDKKIGILDITNPSDKIQKISLDLVIPNRYQPRIDFNETELKELAESIKQFGVLQPVIVRKIDNNFEIVDGERRFRAVKTFTDLKEIPVLVKDYTDKEIASIAIVSNIQRSDLNALEEADAYNNLINKFNYKHEDVANVVGKSRAHITNLLRLLKLPDEIKTMLTEGKISMGHARVLIDNEDAVEIANDIINKGLSVRDTEILAKDYNKKPFTERQKEIKKQKKEYLKDYEEKFFDKLKLKTKVEFNRDNSTGKVIIEYCSIGDLDTIFKKIDF